MATSSDYTIAMLTMHPATRPVMLKYLGPLGFTETKLKMITSTLQDIVDNNTGVSLPQFIIVPLMRELDSIALN